MNIIKLFLILSNLTRISSSKNMVGLI